jgi:tRNA U55 pseudouridine synthase TruB
MPSEEKIIEVLDSFRGTIEQVPPMYSAIKLTVAKCMN